MRILLPLLLLSACTPPPLPMGDADAFSVDGMDAADTSFSETSETGADANTCPILGRDESQGMELFVGYGTNGSLDGYREFRPNDVIWIEPGEQGLQHTVIGLRGRGFQPTNPLVRARLFRARDCEEVGFLQFRFPFVADPMDPTRLAAYGVRVIVNDDDPPDRFEYCTVLGQDVVLTIDFDDLAGRTAHREVRLRVGGIDPNTRPDIRQAWLDACARLDGGSNDASSDATSDTR